MSTLVYSYGAKAPLNPEPVLRQIHQAHEYQNKLIEIERARRQARDAYMATVLPPEKLAREAELVALVDASFKAVRKDRQKDRSRVKMPAEQRAQVAEWKSELKELRAELKVIRAEIRESEGTPPEKCPQCSKKKRCRNCLAAKGAMELGPLGEINRLAHQASLEARASYASGQLYHGTYIAAEDAAKQSFAKAKGEVRWRRWEGTGAVGVQLQGGLALNEIATGTRIQVLTMDQTEWRPGGPNPNLSHWRLLRLRIASEGKGNSIPIWADFPFRMHRPLPVGAVITWVYAHRKRCGTTFSWDVQFTLSIPPAVEPIVHPAPGAVCGIDIGWRKLDEGLRVAVLSSPGHQESVILPLSVLAQFSKPNGIRANRDVRFNAAVLLVQSIRHLWPEWMQEEAQDIGKWRAPAKLARLLRRWRDERFAGDEQVFPLLDCSPAWDAEAHEYACWRGKDKHLWEMESHLRQRAQRARKDIFRNWALSVCQRYGQVVLEGRDVEANLMDLRPLVRLPAEDSVDDPLPQAARNYRTWAACSELRGALVYAAKKTGTVITVAPARYTTMTCVVCGVVDSVERESLEVLCRHCQTMQDQDVRAAINLASAAVPPKPLGALALA